jgi:hypothetical protein
MQSSRIKYSSVCRMTPSVLNMKCLLPIDATTVFVSSQKVDDVRHADNIHTILDKRKQSATQQNAYPAHAYTERYVIFGLLIRGRTATFLTEYQKEFEVCPEECCCRNRAAVCMRKFLLNQYTLTQVAPTFPLG